ncbi:hypothetical protein [Dokdonella sp.]|uniref:hypothetical protein n=1 Tax=Dokdonella sp. TaxID=2291710 RepID=UPI0025BD6768|nr:hypothetical protein [Dokdonella sp.]MBX3691059.1 hypothetical protein [Dokdonella sp.]MCW5566918.1 hypothetical protein [Dokdonella sp.]
MVRQAPVATIIITALLVACAKEAPPPEPVARERQPTVFDEQLKALDKAKAVQQELDEAVRKRDAAAEEQGG